MQNLLSDFLEIAASEAPPSPQLVEDDLRPAVDLFRNEGPPLRPRDAADRPGGLICLRKDIPTVIVPDVHARVDLILSVLSFSLVPWGVPFTVLDALSAEQVQLLFLGDYVHSEARGARRWLEAFEEFQDAYDNHSAMDGEMTESFGVLRMVARLHTAFPYLVQCLKGNHENIANEHREGNIPFGKFAYEGAMVAVYMRRFYPTVFDLVYDFEKQLPLLAVGANFLAGHAEPARAFTQEEIVNSRLDADVVAGLTWTANDAAAPDSVERMLATFLPHPAGERAFYFGGHRPIAGLFNLRANGRYVQIHNPERFVAAVVPTDRPFELDHDVVELPESSENG